MEETRQGGMDRQDVKSGENQTGVYSATLRKQVIADPVATSQEGTSAPCSNLFRSTQTYYGRSIVL